MSCRRNQLLNHENSKKEILSQCGSRVDPLYVNYHFDLICDTLSKFHEKNLSLATLLDFQKEIPVLYPWNTEYSELRFNVNKRFNIFPLLIVMATKSSHVRRSFLFATQYNIPISLRGGSHCFEDFSLSDGMIIDQSRRTRIKIDPSKFQVTVHPGVLLGPLTDQLSHYNLVLPAGDCPNNAAVGLSLGGGIGFLTKKFSVTSDNIIGAKVLTAEGKIIRVTEDSEFSDLLWALRGAGNGQFGIILSLTLRVHSLKRVTVFRYTYPFSRVKEVIDRWQRWDRSTPDELTSEVRITSGGGDVKVQGIYTGLSNNLQPILDKLSSPVHSEVKEMKYVDSARYFGEPGRWLPFFKTKNAFISSLLPPPALQIIEDHMKEGDGEDSFALDSMGGAVHRLSPTSTAFVHRDVTSWMLINSKWRSVNDGRRKLLWITTFYNSLLPYLTSQVYQNAPDLDLENYLVKYYGENLPRLREIKRKWDPLNIFSYAQSIPPN